MSLGLKSKYLSICAKVKHKLISNKLNSIVCPIERTSLADLLICTFLRSRQTNWNGSFQSVKLRKNHDVLCQRN
jgi:hypothetical protein